MDQEQMKRRTKEFAKQVIELCDNYLRLVKDGL